MEETSPPDGLEERSPDWHLTKFIQFTSFKNKVGEPSPHLAMVGYMAKDKDKHTTAWMLGCYAASYCLPTAQVMWSNWDYARVVSEPGKFLNWLKNNWKGIVTRQERRCVRTSEKMHRCLHGYAVWLDSKFDSLYDADSKSSEEYYDYVWDSVCSVPFIGRYIGIRLVEGLRRFCGVQAHLYDVRSMGGWSPKKALVFLYPKEQKWLLSNTPEANTRADEIAADLLSKVKARLPYVNYYVLAGMLCEYREAFERRHQYPAWTIDQEPLLYDKVRSYWQDDLDMKLFWSTRKALFPREALGELDNGWYGTRWAAAKTLRDYGYNWSDLLYNYKAMESSGDFSERVWRDEK